MDRLPRLDSSYANVVMSRISVRLLQAKNSLTGGRRSLSLCRSGGWPIALPLCVERFESWRHCQKNLFMLNGLDLSTASELALCLYPKDVVDALRVADEMVDGAGSAEWLAEALRTGELRALTAMPQTDGEPDQAYALRLCLTVLAELVDLK